jgi:hypothetical protein
MKVFTKLVIECQNCPNFNANWIDAKDRWYFSCRATGKDIDDERQSPPHDCPLPEEQENKMTKERMGI